MTRPIKPKPKPRRVPDERPSNVVNFPAPALVDDEEAAAQAQQTLSSEQKSKDLAQLGRQTDTGNGKRFAAMYADTARYCPAFKAWLVWNGRFWERDDSLHIQRMAKAVVQRMFEGAAKIENKAHRKSAMSWCFTSESQSRLDAMLKSASSELTIRPQELNTDHYLLNCENGTLDLRTGKLRKHDPADFITLMAPVEFRSAAKDARWEELLDKFVRPDDGKEAFLGRAAFASLTGTTSDKAFINLYDDNDGNTGKTTFLESLLAALGPYGGIVNAESFLTRGSGAGGIRSDLAACAGKRMVVSSETPAGRRLDTALMKKLTAGVGVFQFERKYENPWEGQITFTIWIDGNAVAKANAEDNPLFNRWRLTPFMHALPPGQIDKKWMEKAATSPEFRAAVLAWAIRHRAAWLKSGIGTAPSVDAATEEVRTNMDPLREFWERWTEWGEHTKADRYFATTDEVMAAVESWVGNTPGLTRTPSRETVIALMKGRGAVASSAWFEGRAVKGWKGVRVLIPGKSWGSGHRKT